MAKHTQDREDLLRDAKAFVHRIEFQATDKSQEGPIFAGFRSQGALSLYFDQDPVFHFNSDDQLRRAYWQGQLIKAEQGQLVAMRTSRTDARVEMLRHEMTPDEFQLFSSELIERLEKLKSLLQQGRYTINGLVPEESDVLERLKNWLARFDSLVIAEGPRVG